MNNAQILLQEPENLITHSLQLYLITLVEESEKAVQPIIGGQNDVNTPEANAVVRLESGCTGTLITRDVVLTAGHCIDHSPPVPSYDIVGMTSAAYNRYAATRDNSLIMREIIPTWREIGHARGVVAMTSARINQLYAATADGNLVTRVANEQDEQWRRIGHARGVVGLAAAGGSKLYAATRDNNLSVRNISEQDEQWRRIGHANEVVAMTSTNDRDSSMLYIVTRNGKVWKRHPVDYNEDWQHVDRLAIQVGYDQSQIITPAGIVGLAAAEGKLYAATTAHTLNVRYLESHWRRIGHARGVVGLAAAEGKLYAATRDNNLSVRNISEQDEQWRRIGHARGVVAMTSARINQLYAATADGNLVTRVANEQDEQWRRIGHARGVVAMTSGGGGGTSKLYAATADGNLLTRVANEQDEQWRRIGHAGGAVGLAFAGNKLVLVTEDRHMSIRDIIEREIGWDYAEPDKHFAPRMPGRWYNLPTQFRVNFGNNIQSFTHNVNAIQYCLAGLADIMLLKLSNPVPSSIARPMRVLLRTPGSNTNPSQFWNGQQFKLVGWGGGATVRQRTTGSNGVFPRQGMGGPIMMDVQNVTGSLEGGDSGSPLIWRNPQDGENYVIGVCQTNSAAYTVTFSNGGTDSLGLVNPNISDWLRQFG